MERKYPVVCRGHSRPVVDLNWSPVTRDGCFLISASKDSSPILRQGETGEWVGTFEGHKGAVWSCCLDSPAHRAATASADFSAKFWNAISGELLQSFEHNNIVRSCAFSKDNNFLLTGGFEKKLRIYDLNQPDAPPRELGVDSSPVRTVSWLHYDLTILSTCMNTVRLSDVRTGSVVKTLETESTITSAEVSKDERYITTTDGCSVKFWDANHYKLMKSYNMPCPVYCASLEPIYGLRFAAAGEDMWVRLFDFHTGEETACNKGHHGPVHCVRFAPTGETFASGSEDGTLRIWQTGPRTYEDIEARPDLPSEEQL